MYVRITKEIVKKKQEIGEALFISSALIKPTFQLKIIKIDIQKWSE